ncbi:MAG TPA: hypothetical protein EYG38_11460 [Verrucomicrobia bacterium]|nr:hypothetical protein [Verrucomicrobiota bacterium]
MMRKLWLIVVLAFALPGAVAAQAELHFGVSPGQPPGPSVLEIALISNQSELETLKAWLTLEAPLLIETSEDQTVPRKDFSLTSVGVPSVYVYGERLSINRVFRVDPALPDDSIWKVRVEFGDMVLESNAKAITRLAEPLINAATVAVRIGDGILLEEIGTALIDRQPDQTHGYHYRGFALEMQGRYAEAEEDIKTARTIFYENNPPVDADGRMIPNWEPPEILDRVLRRIRAAQGG